MRSPGLDMRLFDPGDAAADPAEGRAATRQRRQQDRAEAVSTLRATDGIGRQLIVARRALTIQAPGRYDAGPQPPATGPRCQGAAGRNCRAHSTSSSESGGSGETL